MYIHKKFINQIIIKRKSALCDLITGEDSIRLEELKPNTTKLIENLDKIFFTIDFLEKNNLITCKRYQNNTMVSVLKGFNFDKNAGKNNFSQVHSLIYLQKKLEESYSWNIEMSPGLMTFVKSGYKTEDKIRERNNVLLAVGIAILSSVLTTLLSSFFDSKLPNIFISF